MRLDKFLVVTRLVKQRTSAKELCDGGHVKINGKSSKPSHDVRVGDEMYLTLPRRLLAIKVLEIPAGRSVPKGQASTYYEIISEERIAE